MSEEVKIMVVAVAVKVFKAQRDLGDTDYTPEDAMVYALEEFDTGYDLTVEGWENLLGRIKCNL